MAHPIVLLNFAKKRPRAKRAVFESLNIVIKISTASEASGIRIVENCYCSLIFEKNENKIQQGAPKRNNRVPNEGAQKEDDKDSGVQSPQPTSSCLPSQRARRLTCWTAVLQRGGCSDMLNILMYLNCRPLLAPLLGLTLNCSAIFYVFFSNLQNRNLPILMPESCFP